MCVFHSPVVAQRFPAPPAAAVRAGQAFCPPDTPPVPAPAQDRALKATASTDRLAPPTHLLAVPSGSAGAGASHMADGGSESGIAENLSANLSATARIGDSSTPPATSTVDGEQARLDAQADSETAGSARANLCPMPTPDGAWTSRSWRVWLAGVHEGQILVPAVAWQAWWTLIAILNGADRSGRSYDLQVKSFEEPFAALTDPKSVYI